MKKTKFEIDGEYLLDIKGDCKLLLKGDYKATIDIPCQYAIDMVDELIDSREKINSLTAAAYHLRCLLTLDTKGSK